MADPQKRKTDPYAFDPGFERAITALACSSVSFWGRGGHAVDTEALEQPACKLAFQAAQEIAKDTGSGPGSLLVVLQRLRRWMNQGKTKLEEIVAVSDLFDEFQDADPQPEAESLLTELVPVLKRRAESEALKVGMDVYAKRGDMGKVIDLVSKAQRLGEQDVSLGYEFGAAGLDAAREQNAGTTLSTGIYELDGILEGGLKRGELGVVAMMSGGGKSMTLNHFAASAMRRKHNVAVATLEIDAGMWQNRLAANILHTPINDIAVDGRPRDRAKREITALQEDGRIGRAFVSYFTPGATTVDDLRDWIRALRQAHNIPIDVLIVDYADEMTAVGKLADAPGHEKMTSVYQRLRAFAKEELKGWCWTASQPKGHASGNAKSRKRIDTDDLADSMGKVRKADVLLTATFDDGTREMTFFLAKRRSGRGRETAGPLPTIFEMGAVAPLEQTPPKAAPKILAAASDLPTTSAQE